jgi:hypothetical protein
MRIGCPSSPIKGGQGRVDQSRESPNDQHLTGLIRRQNNFGMSPSELLALLFRPPEVVSGEDVRAFLKRCGADLPPGAAPFDRLVHVAVRADRRLTASVAGHQAAIRWLFPDTPEDSIVAFCVSEDQGPRPAHILSRLTPDGDGYRLDGSKRWGSLSPLADRLYVAASIGVAEGRNQLRMVRLDANRAGVTIDPSPYGKFRDHMPIADLTFVGVQVAHEEVYGQDAYTAYIKPFRLVEDVFNTVGLQIGLIRAGRAWRWPQDVLEDLVGLVLQAHTIAKTSASRPEDVVLMASYFRASQALWGRLGPCWELASEAERALWTPETGILNVAARARETRRLNAWEALG